MSGPLYDTVSSLKRFRGTTTMTSILTAPYQFTNVGITGQVWAGTGRFGSINMQSGKITSLGTPSVGSDAANKSYVDASVGASSSPGFITVTTAAADGVTDDTAVIQAAIDQSAIDGRIVIIPPGRYLIATTINVLEGVTLRGCNIGNRKGFVDINIGTTLVIPGTNLQNPVYMEQDSTFENFRFHYPDMDPDVLNFDYDFTIKIERIGATVNNIQFLQVNNFLLITQDCTVTNVQGAPYGIGIKIDSSVLNCVLDNITFDLQSATIGAGAIFEYIREFGVGMLLRCKSAIITNYNVYNIGTAILIPNTDNPNPIRVNLSQFNFNVVKNGILIGIGTSLDDCINISSGTIKTTLDYGDGYPVLITPYESGTTKFQVNMTNVGISCFNTDTIPAGIKLDTGTKCILRCTGVSVTGPADYGIQVLSTLATVRLNDFVFHGAGTRIYDPNPGISNIEDRQNENHLISSLVGQQVNFYQTTESTGLGSGALNLFGGMSLRKSLTVGKGLTIGGGVTRSGTVSTTSGLGITTDSTGFQNTSSNNNSVLTETHVNYIAQVPLSASNTNVTVTTASSLTIAGPPTASTNTTLTNSHALWVKSGTVRIGDTILDYNTNEVVNKKTVSVTGTTGGVLTGLLLDNCIFARIYITVATTISSVTIKDAFVLTAVKDHGNNWSLSDVSTFVGASGTGTQVGFTINSGTGQVSYSMPSSGNVVFTFRTMVL